MSRLRGIPSMTGIRGVAAVWVMLFHAQQDAGRIFGARLLERIPDIIYGCLGVDLFFMLSGFILMYAHERDFYVLRKDCLSRFARLRFMRVYPLNAAVLLLIAAFVAFQPSYVAWARSTSNAADFSGGAFVRTFFLATRWFLPGSGDWNQPVWSLSLEVLGYILFPFLAFCALRIVRKWQLIVLASLILIGSYLIMTHFAFECEIAQIAIVRMLSCFVTGILVYRLWALTAEGENKWASWIASASVAGILVRGLPLIRGVLPHFNIQFNFLFGSLLYGLAFQQGVINKLLSSRAAVFLGEISFPLYLIHVAPLLWLRYFFLLNTASYSTLQKSGALAGWALGSIAMATLLHYFVEKPVHAWGRRWTGTRVATSRLLMADTERMETTRQ
jgi:peptidoglycan/LPS O-acetylase OafA/YrhL